MHALSFCLSAGETTSLPSRVCLSGSMPAFSFLPFRLHALPSSSAVQAPRLPFQVCLSCLHALPFIAALEAPCLRCRVCLSGSKLCLTILPFTLHICCCPLVSLLSTCAFANLPSRPCLSGLLPGNSMYCASCKGLYAEKACGMHMHTNLSCARGFFAVNDERALCNSMCKTAVCYGDSEAEPIT